MKQKNRIITRAIHFIEANTNDGSYRIGQAIIEELKLLKDKPTKEYRSCVDCKYLKTEFQHKCEDCDGKLSNWEQEDDEINNN